MNILISSVKIIDPNSAYHLQTLDVLIENGTITQIAPFIEKQPHFKTLEHNNLHLSPAWFDACVDFCDPGFEHKEDINSGLQAALAGGFTAVGVLPNTQPIMDNKTLVEYLKSKAAQTGSACQVFALGAATKQLDGVHLAEMYDMHSAGAIAFTGGQKAIHNTGTMLRSLQYVLPFNGIIVNLPDEPNFAQGAQMNEGITSTQMGTKGKPNIGELLMVQRDIELAKYTQSRVHFAQISTAEAVQAIRTAKKEGVKITAAVSPWHLAFTDSQLIDFDTHWKINPPLRSQNDKNQLIQAVKDGTIDCVSSFHQPQDKDCKQLEFELADFGAIGLQTTFSLLCQVGFDVQEIVEILSIKPRNIFGIKTPCVKIGEKANLTFFQPQEKYIFELKNIRSKSKNTPLLNKQLIGKVIGVINEGICAFN